MAPAPLTLKDGQDEGEHKKTFWALAALILFFTLKGLVWLGLGGAVVAAWRRFRRKGVEAPAGGESGDGEREPLINGASTGNGVGGAVVDASTPAVAPAAEQRV